MDWLIDWLSDWLIDWLVDWVIDHYTNEGKIIKKLVNSYVESHICHTRSWSLTVFCRSLSSNHVSVTALLRWAGLAWCMVRRSAGKRKDAGSIPRFRSPSSSKMGELWTVSWLCPNCTWKRNDNTSQMKSVVFMYAKNPILGNNLGDPAPPNETLKWLTSLPIIKLEIILMVTL